MCTQVPGLFEGDEFTTLMTQCKEGSQKDGLLLDSSEELYKWFTDQVSKSHGERAGRGLAVARCISDYLYEDGV